jgi:ketosteroid isomerase-like protein
MGSAMLASLATGSAAAAPLSNSAGLRDMDVIRNRIGEYSFHYDNRDLDTLAALFWPDATLKVNMLAEMKGRPAIRAWYGSMVDPRGKLRLEVAGKHPELTGYHFNHHVELDGDKAEARADYFSTRVVADPTNAPGRETATTAFNTCGRFRFSLARRDGDWRYQRLEIDIFAGEPA